MVTYPYRRIALFTRAVTVLVACMLPIAAIMVLHRVEDMSTKLYIIAFLTGTFSVSMNCITTATLPEIFQATAA